MKFVTPLESAAHRSLLNEAERCGLNGDALRRLLWLVNAHPVLVAHAQMLSNLLAHLRSPACEPEILAWAGEWKEDLPEWRSVCDWVSENRERLSKLDGLEAFDKQPKHKNDHPHLRHGVARHGVAACLWNRHESAPTYPPDDNCDQAEARYFHLQSMVFLSYAESRFRISTLEFYEQYGGTEEAPAPLGLTSGLSLAVREFSHARYETILHQFPEGISPIEFARQLKSSKFHMDDSLAKNATRHLDEIVRYFRRFSQFMNSGPRTRQRRRTNGGSGGHGWRSGFVHFQRNGRVFIARRPARPADSDIPYQQSDQVWIALDPCEKNQATADEIEQLENLEELFRLYDPLELGHQLEQRRRQDLAVESHVQQLPFAYTRLTRAELSTLYLHLEEVIQDYLHGSPKNVQKARSRARAALILKVMLFLGLPLDVARQLRFSRIRPQQLAQGSLPAADGPTLLLLEQDQGCHGPVAGFCMPGIAPSYRRKLSDKLKDINRPLVDAFILSDVLGVGKQLYDFLNKRERPNAHVFGVEPDIARASVREILGESGYDRLSPEKVRLVLPGILHDQGHDQTVGWMLMCDRSMANAPRMHYTRHSVVNLQRAYYRAARRLARDLGMKVDAPGSHSTR